MFVFVWSVTHPPLSADEGRVNLGALDEIPLLCSFVSEGFDLIDILNLSLLLSQSKRALVAV